MEQPKRIYATVDSDDEDVTKEWLKIDRSVRNDGYLAGLEVSQEHSLQAGFNIGFRQALRMALAGGKLQGYLSARPSTLSNTASASASNLDHAASSDQAGHQTMFPSPSHHNLVSSNTALLASIPRLLQDSLTMKQSLIPHESAAAAASHKCECDDGKPLLGPCSVKKEPQFEYLDLVPALKECSVAANAGRSSTDQARADTPSCHLVCSDQSHFWEQLQHFHNQAHSMEFISAQD